MVFLFILMSIVVLVAVLFYFSKIRIEVSDFTFSSQLKEHFGNQYKIYITLYILRKIPIFQIAITKEKLEKWKENKRIKKIESKMLETSKKIDKDVWEDLKEVKFVIQNIKLEIQLGTENAALTAIIVPVISTILIFLLQKRVKEYQNQKFYIKPVYTNQNLVNIHLSGIIEVKMNHIISIMKRFKKKEGVKKYERASHRRTYDYGYE